MVKKIVVTVALLLVLAIILSAVSVGGMFVFQQFLGDRDSLIQTNQPNKGPKDPANPDDPDDPEDPTFYKRGEWIAALLARSEYPEVLPEGNTFSDIAGHAHEIAIETAFHYGIVDAGEQFMPDEYATREFAALTALRCMGYIPGEDIACADFADVLYPDYAKLAVDMELLTLQENRYLPNERLTGTEGRRILSELEVNKSSLEKDESHQDKGLVYNAGVVCLSTVQNRSGGTPDDPTFTTDGRLILPYSSGVADLPADTILVLDDRHAFKIVSTEVRGNQVLLSYVEPKLYEFLDEFEASGTGYLDYEHFAPADGVTVTSFRGPTPCISGGGEIGIGGEPISFTLEKDLGRGHTLKVELSCAIPSAKYGFNIKFNLPFFGPIVDVKNAYVVVEERTTVTVGITKDLDGANGNYGAVLWDDIAYPPYIELGHIPLLGIKNVGIVLELDLVLNAEGSFEVAFSLNGSLGVQILKNRTKYINTLNFGFDDVGIAGELKVGPKLQILAEFFGKDIISLAADGGLSVAGYAKLRANGMVCVDASISAYLELSALEGTILDDWLNWGVTWKILKNDDSNPFRWNALHMENLHIVNACTYSADGTITGTVVDASNHSHYISGAKIEIFDFINGGDALKVLYSDAEGIYRVNMPDGTYRIRISASGYITFETVQVVRTEEVVFVETFLLVEGSDDETTTAKVGGTITNAVTGYAVSNVQITARPGWNVTYGTATATTVTNSYGRYALTLPLGNYTLTLTKNGYVQNHINVAVTRYGNENYHGTISPDGDSETPTGDLRIVLTWGDTPSDLDSHLVGPGANGNGQFHIYYSNKSYSYNNSTQAFLDVDDTSSYGPETVTVYEMTASGTYSYYVHDYSNRSSTGSRSMANSGAKVQVYIGDTLVATYNVPTTQTGNVWHVFDFDAATGRLTAVNEFSNQSTPSNVGQ